MTITLRPALSGDDEFLFSVYASTRAEEIDLVDWNTTQKEAFLRMQFHTQRQQYQLSDPDAINQIIEFNDVPAGRWMAPAAARNFPWPGQYIPMYRPALSNYSYPFVEIEPVYHTTNFGRKKHETIS